jgi:putative addiction module component (TIGR02574 family)
MAVTIESLGIDQLSVRERLDLVEQILDSLPAEVSPDEIPEWHFAVVAERLADAEPNPGDGVPWEEALARYGKGSLEPSPADA